MAIPVRTSTSTWNIALTRTSRGALTLTLPLDLSAALVERGYNRVDIELSKKGLLLTPYAGERKTPEIELSFK